MSNIAVNRNIKVETEGKWSELRRAIGKNRWAYVFISPFFIFFFIFGLGPFLFSIYMSFAKWGGLGPIEYTGIGNFKYLFGPGGSLLQEEAVNIF